MMKTTSVLLLVCFSFLLIFWENSPNAARALSVPAITQGNIYYVAPTGDNENPGTLDDPWQTIQKAAETLVAGDTVYIRAGTYFEQVIPLNSGSSSHFIT